MLEITRVITISILLVLGSGCTAMLVGGGGSSSDAPQRAAAGPLLAERVRQAFADASLPERAAIGVLARDGVVTLTGRVSSDRVRRQAEQLAAAVAGVQSVNNQLR